MTWKDITIKQFHALKEIAKEHEGDATRLSIKLLALFTGKGESYYLTMPISELTKATQLLSFLNEKPRETIRGKYIVEGQTFILHPNVSKMPTAQYIDYVNTLHTDPENYALLLAILLIPRGKEYNEGYDIHENAALFEDHFSWADVQAIAFFQSAITRIHKTYAKLFESEAEEGNEEGEESGAGGSDSDNYRSFQNRWKWNIIIEHISSYTRFDFERVCKLELMEFLNHASYVKSKIQYHNNQVKKQMAELKKRKR